VCPSDAISHGLALIGRRACPASARSAFGKTVPPNRPRVGWRGRQERLRSDDADDEDRYRRHRGGAAKAHAPSSGRERDVPGRGAPAPAARVGLLQCRFSPFREGRTALTTTSCLTISTRTMQPVPANGTLNSRERPLPSSARRHEQGQGPCRVVKGSATRPQCPGRRQTGVTNGGGGARGAPNAGASGKQRESSSAARTLPPARRLAIVQGRTAASPPRAAGQVSKSSTR